MMNVFVRATGPVKMIDLTFKCSICGKDLLPDEVIEHERFEIEESIFKYLNCTKKHSHDKSCLN